MAIGDRIVQLRKQKNWNQKELAEKLGISARQLVRWELDQVEPRPSSIKKVAAALDVTPEELVAKSSPVGIQGLEDEELQELLRYIPELDENRLEALKMMLRDFVTVHQFNRLTNRQGKAG